jgi:signal transduction histidine kinase
MLGRDRAAIIGKPLVAVVRFDDTAAFLSHLAQSLANGRPVVSELSFSTQRSRFDVQMTSISSVYGTARGCRTAIVDITARRRAERELSAAHATERTLRGRLEAIDRAGGAVESVLVDRRRVEDANDLLRLIVSEARVAAGAKYAALGLVTGRGQPFEPWVFSGMSDEVAARIGRTPHAVGLLNAGAESDQPVRLRDVHQHPSFSGLPAEHPPLTSFLAVPLRANGRPIGTLYLANKEDADAFSEEDEHVVSMLAARVAIAIEVARLRDIEARERARLEFVNRMNSALAESMDHAARVERIVEALVPAIADLCAIDTFDDRGQLRRLAVRHRDPALSDRLKALAASGAPESARAATAVLHTELDEASLARVVPDPERRRALVELGVHSSLSVPLAPRGEVLGMLHLAMVEPARRFRAEDVPHVQEIAHHAILALENARLYRTAQDAIGARDEVLATVAHDLRNPLYGISLGAAALLDEAKREQSWSVVAQSSALIQRAASRADELIQDLLDAARLDAGALLLERASVRPNDVVEDAAQAFQAAASEAGIELRARAGSELPPVFLDRTRIVQALSNLLANAIKHTSQGGRVEIAADAHDHEIVFSVADTGAGISADALPHIFDRFYQAPGARGGSGLGLAIVKKIVDAHMGRIWVESELGRGTSFSFALPSAGAGQENGTATRAA